MIADHFTLLGVLGGRTETTCTHHRFPLTAYVSGSVIVLWDFVKDQKNFIPTHVTCWAGLAFDQDCRHVLGLYLAQDDNDGGKLHVCVFRTVDGELIFETDISEGRSVDDVFVIRGLTDKRLLCIGKSAIGGFAQVLQWDAARLKLCIVSQGSLGNTSGIRSARFLEESDRFVTTESHCIKNWYCQPSAILLTSRINTRQSTNAIQISPVTQLMYLITSKGKAVCVSENGTVLSTFHLAGTVFTTLLLTDQMIYFGSRCGRLLCYSASSLELIRTIECPASQTLSATNVHQMEVPRKGPSVREILSAAGGEFLLVQYSDCSLSVLHASSGQFIAHRISHTGPLSSLALPSLSTGPLSTGAAQKVPPPLLSAALSDRCVISWPPVARAQQATRGFQGGSAPFRTCLPVFLPTRDQEERIIEPDPPDIDGQPVAPLAGQVKVPGAFGVRRNPETLVIESFAPLEDGIAPGVPPQRIRCLSFVPGRERPTSFPSIAKGEHTLQGACLSTQVAVASPRGKRGGGRSALLERERGLVPSVEAPQIDARDGGTAVVGCQDGSIYSLVMKVSAVQIRNKNKMGGERIG
uniref:Uncharacterized protein n=1 Tax=Chromera velia CCMP2878 TaxID=1169474 RepID=A0A0G4GEI3_9ALVE|eukprot:Cvel_21514.t1-p1 / transcript=Cvel_21514.t1 / gene=Cvel_21514 / organism=Chromera_velia_CCMP2878 / gene_product=hypothetical protein / transcript_product=hypothetical protein / location=Cvel_scaffold2025:9602-11341(+) / protein_length=580 / sequence_SO=supercontig / SO=protein_coding / is_pseudo=false